MARRMRKQAKKAGPKRYKPTRVMNPYSAWHTQHQLPCQSLKLKLTPPHKIPVQDCSENAAFAVTLKSEFLRIESITEDKDGDTVYFISPKYDLTDWAEHGEVFLGNIEIGIINNNHPNACPYKVSICVIQSAKDNDNRVITAVNPVNQFIKMEPHQLLEVVCYKREWNDWKPGQTEASGFHDKWTIDINSPENSQVNLEEVKRETVGDHEMDVIDSGPFAIKNRFYLRTNPRLAFPSTIKIIDNELIAYEKPLREHHWWFAFDDKSLKAINNMENDIYDCCDLKFHGTVEVKDADYKTTTCNAKILLGVEGKNKNKIRPCQVPSSIEHKVDVVARIENRSKRILTNPFAMEEIDFYQGYDSLIVEIASPDVFWSDLSEKDEWEVEIEDPKSKHRCLIVVNEPAVYHNGKIFQKFRIEHTYKVKNETHFIGAVNLVCQKKRDCHDGIKRLSCWVTPAPVIYKSPYYPQYDTSSNYSSKTIYQDNKYKGYPKVAEVLVEEIECTSLEDKSGNLIKMTYNFETKKKEAWDQHWGNYRPNSAIENGKRETSGAKKEGEKRTRTSHGRTIWPNVGTNRAPTIIYDPTHLQQIELEYGRDLIIKLSSPTKPSGVTYTAGELWTLTVGAPDKLNIPYHCATPIANTIQQEALISPIWENIPLKEGTHICGGIRIQCSSEGKTVFILVKVTKETLANKGFIPPEPPEDDVAFRVIEGEKLSTSLLRRKIFEWQNFDAVVVSPDDGLFIRTQTSDYWDSEKWQLEVQQISLPNTVCDVLADANLEFNQDNPWFNSPTFKRTGSTWTMEPLRKQQSNIDKIITVISKEDIEELPVAKLIFRNCAHKDNTRVVSPFGTFTSTNMMEKTLGLFLKIKDKKRIQIDGMEVIYFDPDDNDEIAVKNGDELTIKLSQQYIDLPHMLSGKTECAWFTAYIPNFLDVKESGNQIDKWFIFKFIAHDNRGNDEQDLNFVCGNSFRTLKIKYER